MVVESAVLLPALGFKAFAAAFVPLGPLLMALALLAFAWLLVCLLGCTYQQ